MSRVFTLHKKFTPRVKPTSAQLELRGETLIGQDLRDYTGFLPFLNFLRPITRLQTTKHSSQQKILLILNILLILYD